MDLAPMAGEDMLDRVALTLSRRDILLMNLCLELVAHDHTRGSTLYADTKT
jgi:hypothetical protein